MQFMRRSAIARWPISTLPMPTVISGLVMLGLAPAVAWALATENWRILAFLGAVALLPVLATWPVVSTFGIYALCTSSIDLFPFLPGGATVTKLVGVLAGGTLLIAGLIERRLVYPPRAAVWWGAFMVWAALSTAWALDVDLAKELFPRVLNFFLLYLVTVSFRPTPKEVFGICALTVLGGVLASVLAYTMGFNPDAVTLRASRAKLTFGDMTSNPNALGRILLLPLALAVAGLVDLRGTLKRAVVTVCIVLIGIGIYLSMSRGAIVAMSTMFLMLVYRLRRRRYIVAALILLLAVSTAMPASFFQRIGSVTAGEDSTGSGRTAIWSIGMRAVPDFAFVGAGFNNFDMVYRQYSVEYTARTSGQGAHNTYLAVSLELGLIGLVLMLGAVGAHLLAARHARAAGHVSVTLIATEAACVGMLTSAFFGDVLATKPFWLTWTILAWAISSGQSAAHSEPSQQ